LAEFTPADRRSAIEAEYKALEYAPKGQSVSWKGRSGGVSGEVTAAQPYQVGSQNCRQYSHSFTVDGDPQTVRGTACRNEDGSWSPLT
jgi:surface antigen